MTQLAASSMFKASATFDECEREAIHELGSIQSYGAFIAVTADWKVAHYSTNIQDILGIAPGGILGSELSGILLPSGIKALTAASQRLDRPDAVERLFGVDLVEGKPLYDVALHSAGGLLLIEAELHAKEAFNSHFEYLRPLVQRLESIGSSDELFRQSVIMLQDLLGFDRVMAYRFRSDGSGEIVAEAHQPELRPLKGLRFPQSDIPAQARALYLRNRLRIIADVAAEPIAIIPAKSAHGDTLDLSMSILRAVSPTHIQYLKNMGVAASLSISIVHRGKLVGLFACHHTQPRRLPFSLRTVAELFSQLFSLNLDRTLIDAAEIQRAKADCLHDTLLLGLTEGAALTDNLEAIAAELSDIIPHDGLSICVDGNYRARGHAPNQAEFAALLPHLNAALAQSSVGRILAIGSISEHFSYEPDLTAPFADRAAGALIIPVSHNLRDHLVLWRKELGSVVTWAGNPNKDADGKLAPTPRSNFAAWLENVSGYCEEWTAADRAFAEKTQVTLLEVVLSLSDKDAQIQSKAQDQQELLISELNHRVRNILNLIRCLVEQSRHDAIDIASFTELIGGRIGALAGAHDNITQKKWSPAPLAQLIRGEAKAYLGGNPDRFQLTGPEVLLAPNAYTVLALVIHEMVTNSAKYGSLSERSGLLDIELTIADNDDLHIAWRERGGPPVNAPNRRGFGSAIIDHSIPFELKGKAEIRLDHRGLEADFVIPASLITQTSNMATPALPEQANPMPKSAETTGLPKHALVVEDSIIIALDASQTLKALGVASVDTQGDVAGALDAIRDKRPDFAIIDINLGTETSKRVTDELERLNVPFVLATGYGENSVQSAGTGAYSVLRKPYGRAEIAQVLSDLQDGRCIPPAGG